MDPLILTILVAGGIFWVSFILGRNSIVYSRDELIDETIAKTLNHLIDLGYLRVEEVDGELVVFPAGEKK